MYVCVCAYVCVFMWRSRVSFRYCLPYFLRQGLPVVWCPLIRVGWPVNEPKGFTYLHLPIAEVTSACHSTEVLYVESEDQTQVLMHSQTSS